MVVTVAVVAAAAVGAVVTTILRSASGGLTSAPDRRINVPREASGLERGEKMAALVVATVVVDKLDSRDRRLWARIEGIH